MREKAQQDLDDRKRELDKEKRLAHELEQKEDSLRRDLSVSRSQSHPLLSELQSIVRQYSEELQSISRNSALPSLEDFPGVHGRLDASNAKAFFQRFVKALGRERKALDHELSADRESWGRPVGCSDVVNFSTTTWPREAYQARG